MSISEQVMKLQIKELRDYERIFKGDRIDGNLSPIFGNAADTIESMFAKLQAANMERSADCGGWIPCKERLPEESLNSVIGWDEYRKRCCFVQYLGGRWVLGNGNEPVRITAWQPLPEP